MAGAFWASNSTYFVNPDDTGLDFLLEHKLAGTLF